MTKAEYAAEHNGNRERIGWVVAAGRDRLLVKTEDWEPSLADMFFVEGAHLVNPVTGEDTNFDRGFTVVRTFENLDGAFELEVQPWMITTGHFRNIASLPAAGAAIYRPAGEHLRAIHERWMATNR
jgi:hypothetical protein